MTTEALPGVLGNRTFISGEQRPILGNRERKKTKFSIFGEQGN